MPRVIEIDFSDAPPVQESGGSTDHIPPGRYLLKVTKVEETRSKEAQNRMFKCDFTVAQGPMEGKRLRDYFTVEGGSVFGKQRFHGFLVATDIGVRQAAVRFDLDILNNKMFVGDVQDDQMEANGEFSARTVSKIFGYFSIAQIKAEQAAKAQAAAANGAAPSAPPAPVAIAAPVQAMETIELGAPAAVAPTSVPEPATVAQVANDIDNLFD